MRQRMAMAVVRAALPSCCNKQAVRQKPQQQIKHRPLLSYPVRNQPASSILHFQALDGCSCIVENYWWVCRPDLMAKPAKGMLFVCRLRIQPGWSVQRTDCAQWAGANSAGEDSVGIRTLDSSGHRLGVLARHWHTPRCTLSSQFATCSFLLPLPHACRSC